MYRTLILCSLLTLAACETEGLEATCAVGDVVDQTDPSVARMLHGAEVLDAGITTSTDRFDEAGDWLQVNSREFTVLLANGAQAGVSLICSHSGCTGEACQTRGCSPLPNEVGCTGASCTDVNATHECTGQKPRCSQSKTVSTRTDFSLH